jgi:hypothetical protein
MNRQPLPRLQLLPHDEAPWLIPASVNCLPLIEAKRDGQTLSTQQIIALLNPCLCFPSLCAKWEG